jgi:large subunit ribosomal protein L35
MPKMKTVRAAAKRFSSTGGKVIRRKCAYRRHLLSSKSSAQKRHLRDDAVVHPTNVKAIRVMLPYG